MGLPEGFDGTNLPKPKLDREATQKMQERLKQQIKAAMTGQDDLLFEDDTKDEMPKESPLENDAKKSDKTEKESDDEKEKNASHRDDDTADDEKEEKGKPDEISVSKEHNKQYKD